MKRFLKVLLLVPFLFSCAQIGEKNVPEPTTCIDRVNDTLATESKKDDRALLIEVVRELKNRGIYLHSISKANKVAQDMGTICFLNPELTVSEAIDKYVGKPE